MTFIHLLLRIAPFNKKIKIEKKNPKTKKKTYNRPTPPSRHLDEARPRVALVGGGNLPVRVQTV